ncbi:hypothetical protein QZH41_019013, partial [Actinostola sp. cb2023]
KKLKVKRQKRLFPKAAVDKVSQASAVSSVPPPGKPLFNQKFAIIGKLKRSQAELSTVIEDLGGKVVEKVNTRVTCCISSVAMFFMSSAEVDKKSKKMKDAESLDVPVVSEDFLEAVKDGGAALKLPQHSIVSWGKNKGLSCVDGPTAKGKTSASRFTSGIHEKKVTLSVKGGAVVDPESGLENSCHVLEVKGAIYNAILGLVDIVRGTNSYYKLQVLKKDHGNSCYLFRSWGRVGTTIGGNKLEKCASQEDALLRFCDLYAEKTGNSWSNRTSFVKHPNRFYPLEIDYGQDDVDLKKHSIEPGSQSKLAKPVQNVIKMIFDVESMKQAMVEFEVVFLFQIDLKKMPLGKLTRRQIERAYSTLGEAQRLVSKGGSTNGILDASNRFYTLIPHDFGMRKPPMLDNMDLINSKVIMLDNLLEIEVAYSLLKSGGDDEKDPIDVNYEKLNTNLEVLEHSSSEFAMLTEYVKNTHASTHQQYELEVTDIFKVERHGEASMYKPFKELHNRQLLWHGSSNTNYAGILSQGLRIAPSEAPTTGYMFGKGVYFAGERISLRSSTKATDVDLTIKYLQTTAAQHLQNNVGFLLLCEVALGNMHELKNASYINKPPKGKHSVKVDNSLQVSVEPILTPVAPMYWVTGLLYPKERALPRTLRTLAYSIMSILLNVDLSPLGMASGKFTTAGRLRALGMVSGKFTSAGRLWVLGMVSGKLTTAGRLRALGMVSGIFTSAGRLWVLGMISGKFTLVGRLRALGMVSGKFTTAGRLRALGMVSGKFTSAGRLWVLGMVSGKFTLVGRLWVLGMVSGKFTSAGRPRALGMVSGKFTTAGRLRALGMVSGKFTSAGRPRALGMVSGKFTTAGRLRALGMVSGKFTLAGRPRALGMISGKFTSAGRLWALGMVSGKFTLAGRPRALGMISGKFTSAGRLWALGMVSGKFTLAGRLWALGMVSGKFTSAGRLRALGMVSGKFTTAGRLRALGMVSGKFTSAGRLRALGMVSGKFTTAGRLRALGMVSGKFTSAGRLWVLGMVSGKLTTAGRLRALGMVSGKFTSAGRLRALGMVSGKFTSAGRLRALGMVSGKFTSAGRLRALGMVSGKFTSAGRLRALGMVSGKLTTAGRLRALGMVSGKLTTAGRLRALGMVSGKFTSAGRLWVLGMVSGKFTTAGRLRALGMVSGKFTSAGRLRALGMI